MALVSYFHYAPTFCSFYSHFCQNLAKSMAMVSHCFQPIQVLQRSYLDMELSLLAPESGNKENHGPIAKVRFVFIIT